jgi:hypothetical protein
MSGSNRLLIACAAGITLFLALSIGAYFGSLYSPAHKQYQAVGSKNSADDDYNGPTESLPDIAFLPGPVERAIANPQPKSGQDHEMRDLAAQESMSVWAFWGVAVTTIGTIFLAWQIGLTRKAVQETAEATMAMERQNELAEDTAARQLRAYVGAEEIGFEINSSLAAFLGENDETGIFRHFAWIMIKNFGQTPAFEVEVHVRIVTIPFAMRLPDNFDFNGLFGKLESKNFVSKSFLQGGQTEISKIGLENANAVIQARNKDLSLYVFGRIYYRDAFGKHWSTKLCHVWEPWHPGGERFVPYSEFNGEDQEKPVLCANP